jgi:hypothetical protein
VPRSYKSSVHFSCSTESARASLINFVKTQNLKTCIKTPPLRVYKSFPCYQPIVLPLCIVFAAPPSRRPAALPQALPRPHRPPCAILGPAEPPLARISGVELWLDVMKKPKNLQASARPSTRDLLRRTREMRRTI